MKNPWEEIDLEIYESHMRLDSVMQLQAMNAIMKKQLEAYPAATAMILGVAGGNGLEHIRCEKYHTVYGVDINADYLRAVTEQYQELSGVLQYLPIDLTKYADQLPEAQRFLAEGSTIAEAALMSGFYDQSHFDKYFKKIVGLSPKDYVSSLRNFLQD